MEILTTLMSFELQFAWTVMLIGVSIASIFFVIQALLAEIVPLGKLTFMALAAMLLTGSSLQMRHIVKTLVSVPTVSYSSPKNGEEIHRESPKISIRFSAPVLFRTLAIHTSPSLDLIVKPEGYLRNLIPFGTTMTIVPKTTLPPGEHYMLYLANIEGPLTQGYGGEQLLEVATADVEITDINVIEGANDINPSGPFTIHVSEPIVSENEWSAHLDPSVALTAKKTNATTLEFTPQTPLTQGSTYTLTVLFTPIIRIQKTNEEVQRLDARTKSTRHFTTVKPGFVSSFEPKGESVDPASDIHLVFDEPMDRSSVMDNISINPTATLSPSWESSDKELTLRHTTLSKNTDYTVTLRQGTKTAKGGILEKDAVNTFHTAGPLTITSTTPQDGAGNTSTKTKLQLTFDQTIPNSIHDHIRISPEVAGKETIKDALWELVPDAPLASNTRYTIHFDAGAPSVYGLPSDKERDITFTTGLTQVSLDVPYFHQQTLFTCNIAAARMLLSYRGVQVTEGDLINVIGLGGKRGSGNPYKGYVDDYGTYWDAVLRGVTHYHAAHLITSGNLSDILSEVKKGNPVMTWGQNGWSDPHDISWTATDGTFIHAINGMHSAVVRGYVGSEDNPSQILINDPWRGQYAIATSEFMRRWRYFSMAMVIE